MAEAQSDITLYYEGKDITEDVDIIECRHRDMSSGESDCLNLLLDHADRWFKWKPQRGDTIRATRGGYDTGILYLNTIAPEDGAYRIYATGAKPVSPPIRSASYEEMTLQAILSLCAGECGMGAKLYGVNGGILYGYLLRDRMNAPMFIQQMARREGAVVKAVGGAYTVIGIPYAQGISAMHKINLDDDQMDSEYISLRSQNWKSVEIRTKFGKGKASDGKAEGQTFLLSEICAENDAAAYRWAKGLLMNHNRQNEILKMEMDFNPGYTAMVRIDVESGSDAAGRWLIDQVEHDMVNGRSKARMLRCIESIA